MRIDGRLLAEKLKRTLKLKVDSYIEKHIYPHLAVVIVGFDPSSLTYISQKRKVGEEIGVRVSILDFPASVEKNKLFHVIGNLNADITIHGIIIQRPVPLLVTCQQLNTSIIPSKDVDGFHPNSLYTPPIASAVLKIMQSVHKDIIRTNKKSPLVQKNKLFLSWLKSKKILVIGRGETAGKPIADTLQKLEIQLKIAHSKTNNLRDLCLTSDIIISCVGRPYIVRHDMVTSKTILIGVGLHGEDGKLKADYHQDEIANTVAYYTPVPGGIGPVNVACLFENVIKAAKNVSI